MVNVGGREVQADLVVMVTGALVFVFGFIDFFSYGGSGANGYETGFLSSAGIALVVFAALLAVCRAFLGMTFGSGSAVGPAVLIFGLSALGAALLILKLIVGFHSTDRSVGLYLAFIAAIVQAVFAFLSIAGSGERLPDFKRSSTSR